MINGNAVGGIVGYGKTFILTDENGNELTGVVTGEEVVFTADAANDIRSGKVAATSQGIVTGSKIFPIYTTCAGKKIVPAGSEVKIVLSVLDTYDYTNFQCIICPFNSSMDDSVAAEKVVIDDNLYDVNSTTVISTIVKNATDKSIDFGIVNSSSVPYIIRFFTYKDIE